MGHGSAFLAILPGVKFEGGPLRNQKAPPAKIRAITMIMGRMENPLDIKSTITFP